MKRKLGLLSISVLAIAVLTSCGQNAPTAPSSMSGQSGTFRAQSVGAPGSEKVGSGQVTITKGLFYHQEPLVIEGETGQAVFESVHLGHWDIYVELFNAQGVLIYAGAAEAVVKPKRTTEVLVTVTDDLASVTPKPTPPGQGNPPENNTSILIVNVDVPVPPIPEGLILWSKLGSQTEVEHSEVGPNGIIVGQLLYESCQFGNGFRSAPRTGDLNIPDNYIKYEGLNLGHQGCLEFWYRPYWNSTAVGHVINIVQYIVPEDTNSVVIDMAYNDWQNRLGFAVSNEGRYETVAKYIVPSSTPEWVINVPMHVALVWDGTEAVPAQKVRLYLNGNERGYINGISGSPTFDDWNTNKILFLGSRAYSGDWSRHHWEGNQDGVIDNIKIWDHPKTDFSDRFEE